MTTDTDKFVDDANVAIDRASLHSEAAELRYRESMFFLNEWRSAEGIITNAMLPMMLGAGLMLLSASVTVLHLYEGHRLSMWIALCCCWVFTISLSRKVNRFRYWRRRSRFCFDKHKEVRDADIQTYIDILDERPAGEPR